MFYIKLNICLRPTRSYYLRHQRNWAELTHSPDMHSLGYIPSPWTHHSTGKAWLSPYHASRKKRAFYREHLSKRFRRSLISCGAGIVLRNFRILGISCRREGGSLLKCLLTRVMCLARGHAAHTHNSQSHSLYKPRKKNRYITWNLKFACKIAYWYLIQWIRCVLYISVYLCSLNGKVEYLVYEGKTLNYMQEINM